MRWVLALFLVWPVAGWGLCISPTLVGVTATATNAGSGSGYNAFDTAEYQQTVSFQVQNSGSLLGCTYFVALKAGQSANGAARQLRYNSVNLGYDVYTSSSKTYRLMPATGGTANTVLAGSFGGIASGMQSANHSFVWVVPPQQTVPYATGAYYTDPSVSLDLYEGTVTGFNTIVHSVPITFRSLVVRSVDVAVVGSGGSFSIGSTSHNAAFGTAVAGATRDFDILVRSTDGYRLALQSVNKQRLVHATRASSTIPYTMTVNSVAVDLSGGGSVSVGTLNGVTAQAGTRLPVRVTLGSLGAATSAGIYSDTVNVTVSAF